MVLTLVTPEKSLITHLEIDRIVIPGNLGELEVLPGHAPLVTTLQEGILRYTESGSTTSTAVAVSWGYAEVYPNGIKVLAETAETAEELENERAEHAKNLAETKLKEGLTVGESMKYQRKLKRANTRLDVLKHYSKN